MRTGCCCLVLVVALNGCSIKMKVAGGDCDGGGESTATTSCDKLGIQVSRKSSGIKQEYRFATTIAGGSK